MEGEIEGEIEGERERLSQVLPSLLLRLVVYPRFEYAPPPRPEFVLLVDLSQSMSSTETIADLKRILCDTLRALPRDGCTFNIVRSSPIASRERERER